MTSLSEFQFIAANGVCAPLRVYGDTDHPLFVAREIAHILELESSYRNFVQTLDADEKTFETVATKGGRQSMTLITESAVYKMIFKSRKPIALKFQNWICKEVLPTLRRTGEIRLQRQVDDLHALLREQERATHQLEMYVENVRLRCCSQYIYIATSESYAAQNIFKIGGCASANLLTKRLSTYNSGRAVGDHLYFTVVFPCHNYTHAECRIKELLGDFRYQKDREMYVLHYTILREFVERVMQTYQNETEYLNRLLENLLHAALKKPPIVPPPLSLDVVALSTPVTKKPVIDLDQLAEDEQHQWMRKWIAQYRVQHDASIIERAAFEQFVGNQTEFIFRFKKMTLWKLLKTIVQSESDLSVSYSANKRRGPDGSQCNRVRLNPDD